MNQDDIQRQIERAWIGDRYRLRKLARVAPHSSSESNQRQRPAVELVSAIAASVERCARRQAAIPRLKFPSDLPINAHRAEIAQAIRQSQVVVICGETGSGKSTQLPKICLDAGFGVHGMIGHTQPRRIAARSIAARIAAEMETQPGAQVGFKVRFADKTQPQTLVKLMTDGILLAEIGSDRFLEQYELIIVDEAHERSLNIDFLMGYIKRLLPKRPELRVIITSATIDAERFANHYSMGDEPAPIIQVSGRTFPVEVRYQPLMDAKDDQETDQLTGIVSAVHQLAAIDAGHILVFLPTERDIRETAQRLRAEKLPGDGAHRTEILPLYARLSSGEQDRVFQPRAYRRIVLATNVAESSLTVPGIRYVIDTGTARISRYAPRSKVQRLPIERISQASANQRAGRCGRVADGICIRLYSEADFAARSAYTTPEIQRTNLASVILQAKANKLGDVESFPFLDPPRREAVRDGYQTLFEIEALDDQHNLTRMGRKLSRLPIDPRLARIIVAAEEERCLREILVIASVMEIQDPRERPVEKQQAADLAQEKFIDLRSDFLSYLKLWDFYHDLKGSVSRNQLRKACQQNFLSFNRMREWTEIYRQLQQMLSKTARQQVLNEPHNVELHHEAGEAGTTAGNPSNPKYAAIHRALLTGFLSGVAYLSGEHEYTGAGNVKFFLWPGSGLFHHKPKWCLAAELIETGRRYGRTVARIDPGWIEPLAQHCVARSYSDPHWHRKQGTVMALERVSLFGLPIVLKRRVRYGRIDPVESHEIFIQDGLNHDQQNELWRREAVEVSGDAGSRPNRQRRRHGLIATEFAFFRHNHKVLAEVAKLAAKTRSNEYLIDDALIRNFYRSRIDPAVFDWQTLRAWFQQDRTAEQRLRMSVDDLLGESKQTLNADDFPNALALGALQLPVSYRFAPGEADDGVSVIVPQDAIGHLQAGLAGWLIPGLFEDRVTALIRSLPKSLRRNFIPAPDTARQVASSIEYGVGDFFQQVVDRLNQLSDERVSTVDFQLDNLPEHLRLNIKVVDNRGKLQAQGRDLVELRRELGSADLAKISQDVDPQWQRTGITAWDFDQLPEKIVIQRSGIEFPVHPAVIDQGDAVQLQLLESAALAQHETIGGICRLYAIQQKKSLRSQIAWLPEFNEITVYAASLMTPDELRSQLGDLLCRRAFLDVEKELPHNFAQFTERMSNAAERIGLATQDVSRLLPKLFRGYHETRLALDTCQGDQFRHATSDIQGQMSHLLARGFLTRTPWRWLVELPRYLRGMTHRVERLTAGTLARDIEYTYEISELWQQYLQVQNQQMQDRVFDAELELYRWMLEEYRVSCFAQTIGTAFTVSAKRLEKQWAKVQR